MSEPTAIQFHDVGKVYRIYPSRRDGVLDSLGLTRFPLVRGATFREFWALRGINLAVASGQRLGIVGRNGAGKTTLLKLMTGNIAPTEGKIDVTGRVQALLEAGGGLHPEFTGHENIHAALTYQGLAPREISEQTEDIEDFTELGEFLEQPLKTYSLGMQARLAFAIATTLEPEILIIDEVLGAGDAYFFTKSTQRMTALVDSGATVLLVTHALEQVERFCDEAIWLERGRIVARGSALEVLKQYEAFIRRLEDDRLRAKNLKVQSRKYTSMQQELYADGLLVRVGLGSGSCDVSEVALIRDGELEDTVRVGDAQDADPTQSASILVDTGWSEPREESERSFRRLVAGSAAAGSVQFHLWAFYEESRYAFEFTYRASPDAAATTAEIMLNGELLSTTVLPESSSWRTQRVELPMHDHELRSSRRQAARSTRGSRHGVRASTASGARSRATTATAPRPAQETAVSRWLGIGSLLIERVLLLDDLRAEQAVFTAFSPMKLELTFRAQTSGTFPLAVSAIFHTLDGVRVFAHVSEPMELLLEEGESRTAILDLGGLNLGDGRYVISVGLYEDVSQPHGPQPYYDHLDRSYEFQVVGSAPYGGIFQHPGGWSLR